MSNATLKDHGDSWELQGLATTWSPYKLWTPNEGDHREHFLPESLEAAWTGRDRVELRVQHADDRGYAPLAATGRSQTLSFTRTDDGLQMRALLAKDDPDAQAAVSKVRRGILDRLSIGFYVKGDSWSGEGPTRTRTINAATLREVSLVVNPANPSAVIHSVRGDATGEDLEVRYVGDGIAYLDQRRDFTAAELVALGKAGKAIWLDGHWAYPTPARSDYDNAVQALGRTPGKNRAAVRKYLMRRARAEGWPIPASWNSDGSTKSASRSDLDPATLALVARGDALTAAFDAHVAEFEARENFWRTRPVHPAGRPARRSNQTDWTLTRKAHR